MLDQLTGLVAALRSLDAEQARLAVGQLVDENIPATTKAEFLAALARKGETTEEITEFARALRDKSIAPPLDPETRAREILDVCGTGGDRLGTFNISTTVAIVCAAAGVTVAKHGNRAITSEERARSGVNERALGSSLNIQQLGRDLALYLGRRECGLSLCEIVETIRLKMLNVET